MEEVKIVPTVGRMVYYKSRGSADGVFPTKDRAATISDVKMEQSGVDGVVVYKCRLCVFNPEGIFFSDWIEQGQQPGQWDWMPYQKGQAKKTEELEEQLKNKS